MLSLPDNGVYYHAPATHPACATGNLRCISVDLARLRTLRGALRKLAGGLAFPAWFGHNLDALFDCLTDPEGFAAADTLLTLSGLHSLAKADPAACAALLEVLRAASDSLRDEKRRCIILIDSPLADLAPLP